MPTDTESIRRRADDFHGRYRYAFAGKPRITRRLEDLDEIIRGTRALVDEARAGLGADAELTRELDGRLSLYETERAAIVEAKAAGSGARQATVLGSRANALFGVYARYFAGKSRATRDVALLDDLIDCLLEVRADLHALAQTDAARIADEQLGAVERNVDLWVQERDAILAARASAEPGERTAIYANLANAQFDAYRRHFAGRARLSRRVPLIDRLAATLRWCRSGMQEQIAAGVDVDTNNGNLRIVEERLAAYEKEAEAIRKAREDASVFEIIDALGQDANLVMEEYANHFAGQNRATRDLDLLGTLLDRLVETERQMWALNRVHDNPTNERNVAVVQDTIIVYLREYDAIREAQAT